ncbi:MAG: hypothetical protein ABSH05_26255 [Bryobacteraceae bacterium]|jgi:hypothetical protein
MMGRWRKSSLVVLGVGVVAWYFLLQPPLSLALIVAGSLAALGTTISDPKNDHFKVTLAATAAAIVITGGVTGYFNGLQAQKEAKASSALLRAKTDEIATVTKQGLDLAQVNTELSRALINKSLLSKTRQTRSGGC